MNANLDMYWDADCTVIVMANLDPPIAQKLSGYIRDRIQPSGAGVGRRTSPSKDRAARG